MWMPIQASSFFLHFIIPSDIQVFKQHFFFFQLFYFLILLESEIFLFEILEHENIIVKELRGMGRLESDTTKTEEGLFSFQ